MPRLRSSEWLLLAYFTYVALISPFFISPGFILIVRPFLVAAVVASLVLRLARSESWFRDLAPLLLTLAAFREMNWFTPAVHDHPANSVSFENGDSQPISASRYGPATV